MTLQTHWQDLYGGNWGTALKGAGVFKAGEGRNFSDAHFADWLKVAARDGHHAYAYYALHQGSKAEIVQQATRAQSLVGKRSTMFDVEVWPAESGSPAGIATLGEVTEAVDTFRAQGGTMNVIYLPRSMWERIGSPDLTPLRSRGLHLLNADYRKGSESIGSPAWHGYGGMPVWAVQYAPEHNTSGGSWPMAQAVWERTVPKSARAPEVIEVKRGDTMISIAKAHQMDIGELEHLNPHAGHPAGHFDLIQPGDLLTVAI